MTFFERQTDRQTDRDRDSQRHTERYIETVRQRVDSYILRLGHFEED